MVSVDFVLEGELGLKVGLQLDGPVLVLFGQPRLARGDQIGVSLSTYRGSRSSAFIDATVPRLCWVAGYLPCFIFSAKNGRSYWDSHWQGHGGQSSWQDSQGWGEGGVPLGKCEGR